MNGNSAFPTSQPAITFENLPVAVSSLIEKVDQLIHSVKGFQQPEVDEWFDLDSARDYIPSKPSKPTLYRLTSQRLIPFHKKGKKIIFLKSDLDKWLASGKQSTIKETAEEVDSYLSKK